MAPDSFDWSLVQRFLAVLDAGSLVRAARALGSTQPTLSRQIAQLEAQLGAPLFERTGRGVVPTALALALGDGARRMAAGADAVALALAGRRGAPGGTVRITTSCVAASWLLPPLLAELARAEPDLGVELVASDAVANLLRREADIAVRMLRPAQGSLTARKLGDVAIVAAAQRGYLARAGMPRRSAELLQHRLVGYDRDDTLLRGFAALGQAVQPGAFALRTDDQVAYVHLVAQGGGIGFVAAYVLPSFPALRRVLPALAIPPLPCWLAVHREIRGNPAVRRVFDFLADKLPARLAG